MKTFSKGSVLAYSLIILFVMLTIVLAMSAVAIKDRNSAMTSGDSVQAFQTANAGSEIFLKAYKNQTNKSLPVNTTTSWDSLNCSTGSGGTQNLVPSSGPAVFLIELRDSNDQKINCSGSSGKNISDIASIKVTGNYGGTSRAIEVAMAAGTDFFPLTEWSILNKSAATSLVITGVHKFCFLSNVTTNHANQACGCSVSTSDMTAAGNWTLQLNADASLPASTCTCKAICTP